MTPTILKAIVPPAWRPRLRSAWTRLRHVGTHFECNVCGAGLRRFLDYGIPPESEFLCPVCRSKPPHRLTSRWFDLNPGCLRSGGIFVHIAPEAGLGRRLQTRAAAAGMQYRAGGIADEGERRLDILALPFEDASVDLLFCCHVLNSLQDDLGAIREVFRVLRADGLAILQVPAFHTGDGTIETDGQADRIAAFSDDGIYRCYSAGDFERRLRDAGFDASAFVADSLPPEAVHRYQLKHEILHLCRKSAA